MPVSFDRKGRPTTSRMATIRHIVASPSESTAQQEAQPGRVGESLLDRIGNPPLLQLQRVGQDFQNIEFCAKSELLDPGGPAKDLPALTMILAGRAAGALLSLQPLLP